MRLFCENHRDLARRPGIYSINSVPQAINDSVQVYPKLQPYAEKALNLVSQANGTDFLKILAVHPGHDDDLGRFVIAYRKEAHLDDLEETEGVTATLDLDARQSVINQFNFSTLTSSSDQGMFGTDRSDLGWSTYTPSNVVLPFLTIGELCNRIREEFGGFETIRINNHEVDEDREKDLIVGRFQDSEEEVQVFYIS